MRFFTRPSRLRASLWLVAIALLFAALSPTLNALRIKAIGEPQAFAELCTKLGMVKIALDGDGKGSPPPSGHGPECAWCLPGQTWLGAPASDIALSFALQARHESPPAPVARALPRFVHPTPPSRGPPITA